MTELVLAVNREELVHARVGMQGIYKFSFKDINQRNYALLPRAFADNKSGGAVGLGTLFPQILGYFQVMYQGKILTYQRKGKEEGLLGKWSIGVGGHVSQEDLVTVDYFTNESYPNISELVLSGAIREVEEELGLDSDYFPCFDDVDSFVHAADKIISTGTDLTSTVHVGIPITLELTDHAFKNIKLDPAEFLNVEWLTPDELRESGKEFETWTELLVSIL